MTRARLLLLALVLSGCPSEPVNPFDAGADAGGSPTDTGTDTGGGTDAPTVVATSCTAPRDATLAAGVNMLSGNSSGMGMVLSRGGCGGTALAPQEIIEVTIPGAATESTGVRFSLQLAGTAETFDTVVEVRETCADAATALCFDDFNGDYRSAGAFSAPGGSTRYFVVTGFAPPFMAGNTSSGPWQMGVEIVPNQHAPVLTSATVLTIGSNVRLGVVGSDADGDANFARVTFLDAGGTPVPFDLDADTDTPDVTDVFFELDAPLGATAGEATSELAELADFAGWANVVTATVVVIDDFQAESAEVTATEMTGMYADVGDACDATNVCRAGILCETAVCTIPAPVLAVCDAATTLALTPGTPATTVVTVPTGDGVITNTDGGCTDSLVAGEALVDITLPTGTWDLVANTAGAMTADTDTVLFLVRTCGDTGSQVACTDDEETGTIESSLLEVSALTAGDYTLVVEVYGGADAATPVNLSVSLLEVLATGATCDPAGVANRCATGVCPATGTAVCP